jgi:hypothetical protein
MSIKKKSNQIAVVALSLGLSGLPLFFSTPFAQAESLFKSQEKIPTIVVEQESQMRSTNSENSQTTDIVVAATTANLGLDLGKKQSLPIMLTLVQPFRSIPVGALIKATIIPTEDGDAEISADAIIFNGKAIALKAKSDRLPGKTVRVRSRMDEAKKYGIPGGVLGGLSTIAFGKDVNDIVKSASAATLVSGIFGYLSPKDLRIIEIPAGTTILLNSSM